MYLTQGCFVCRPPSQDFNLRKRNATISIETSHIVIHDEDTDGAALEEDPGSEDDEADDDDDVVFEDNCLLDIEDDHGQ